jgi:cytochrome c
MAELTGSGKKATAISGEQIFKNICSSCHSFDHKIVGPPYEQTLPKYEGHVDQLIAFIRNPVKKNPGYPPMPNPGLSPVEADSIAHYIMATYKKK